MKIKQLIYTLIISIIILGCGSDDEDILVIQLLANAGAEQTVTPFTEVTLDGSASTGPEGFNYEWIYNGSESINLSSTSEAKVTFTPEKNATYSFTLRLTNGAEFSEAQTNVTVTGAVVLDASSFTSETLTLTNVEPFETGPDYIINADFTIPAGKTLDIGNDETVTIGIADGTGIIVNGRLSVNSTLLLEANSAGWKGVLVDGGSIDINSLFTIDQAGNAAFDGHEAAAITFVNGGSMSSTNTMTITNTISDLGMVLTPTTSSNWDMSNGFSTITALVPVKAPIGYLPKIANKVQPSGDYDYLHFTTSGAGVTEGSVSGAFSFNTYKHFIDGDFTAGSQINVTNNSAIFMKAGAGIVCSDVININNSTIEGLNGATWKGIAGSQLIAISSSSVINAGSDVHNTGSFSTTEKAAIHANATVNIQSSSITNSQGYGVYLNGSALNNTIQNTVFDGTINEDVNLPYGMVGSSIKTGNTWSKDVPVALRATSNNGGAAWLDLGVDKAYLATENLVVSSGQLILNPGVHIKFQSGTSLTVNTGIIAEGMADDPIVFDGENDAPGSWNGIHLFGIYKMAYCTINNGGGIALSGGEKTNVLFNAFSSSATYPRTNYSFENNTVSNSAGYGVQVFLGKYDPVTSATNTYTNNTSGDIKLP